MDINNINVGIIMSMGYTVTLTWTQNICVHLRYQYVWMKILMQEKGYSTFPLMQKQFDEYFFKFSTRNQQFKQ